MRNSSTIYQKEGFKGPYGTDSCLVKKKLEIFIEIEYLGITLDKGLMWRIQLKQSPMGLQRHLWDTVGTET
jgi:hypothetical protein